jgi:hypothetical protein
LPEGSLLRREDQNYDSRENCHSNGAGAAEGAEEHVVAESPVSQEDEFVDAPLSPQILHFHSAPFVYSDEDDDEFETPQPHCHLQVSSAPPRRSEINFISDLVLVFRLMFI